MEEILFDKEAFEFLKAGNFDGLSHGVLVYDAHLVKAYTEGLININDIKKVIGLNRKELELKYPYIYNARCCGKVFNFRECFSKEKDLTTTPYKTQVGGTHYISKIQPVQFIKANKLNFNQGNIVKYIARYDSKNGIEDLAKVIQYTLFEAYEEYPEKYKEFVNKIKTMIGE